MTGKPLYDLLNKGVGVGKQTIFSLSNFHTLTEGINAAVSGPQTLKNYARAFLSDNFTQGLRNGSMANDFVAAAKDGVTKLNSGSGSSADASARFVKTLGNRLTAGGVGGAGGAAAGYTEAKVAGKSDEEARGDALKYGLAGTALAGIPLGSRGTVSEILSSALWDRAVPVAKVTAYKGLVNGGMNGREAADIVNERFGGLNYAAMGRDPTIQDALRLSVMAPDWTESTVRQLGSAMFGGTGQGVRAAHVAKALAGTMATTELLNWFSTGHSTIDNQPGHQFEVEVQDPNGEYMHIGVLPGNYQSYLGLGNKLVADDAAKRQADLVNFGTGRLSAPAQMVGTGLQTLTARNPLQAPYGVSKAGPAALGEALSPISLEQVAQGVDKGGVDPSIAIIMAALGLNPRYSATTGSAGGNPGGVAPANTPLPARAPLPASTPLPAATPLPARR